MFDWFKRKKAEVQTFPDNQHAFAHACTLGYHPLVEALIPALVQEEGGRGSEGEHLFLINLAGSEGGMRLWCCTLKESRTFPCVGDLVGFRVVTIASDVPEPANLIGYIACRLEPVFVTGKGWVVSRSYTPEEIKPALHL